MKNPTRSLADALAELTQRAQLLGVSLEPAQLDRLSLFLDELAAYNQHTNMVARADPWTLVHDHVLDSLTLVPCIERTQAERKLVDIGSGAGFPGLVLALSVPDLEVVLSESIAKKARFLEAVISRLSLFPRVQVRNDRAESLGREPGMRGCFGLATARAVGTIDLVAELALPMLNRNGWLLAQKSLRQLPDERRRLERALPILGAQLREVVSPDVEAVGKERAILIIEKIEPTSDRYPRSTSQIKARPLGASPPGKHSS